MARHCGKCGRSGHYVSTCGNKKKKTGVVRRRGTSKTASRRGRRLFGKGKGWVVLHHSGSTGDTQHDKTWSAKIISKNGGWSVVTRHGRRTGQKNETVRKPTTSIAAHAELNRLIASKLRKGYYLVGSYPSARRRVRSRGRRS